MSIIAVYNIKGGVGKTATSVNLAYLAAQQPGKTLLLDMDPQASASFYFRIRPSKKFGAEKLLRGGRHIEENIKGTDYPGLDMLPADFSYRNIDLALGECKKSHTRLGKVLAPLREEYGRIILDCPPNLTLLSENVLFAADYILVPVIPTTLSLLSLDQLFAFLDKIGLAQEKMVLFFSMVEKRKKIHTEMMQSLRERSRVLRTAIPYSADIERMGVYRQPVAAALPAAAATAAYKNLWQEVQNILAK
ncbi:MAG: AAA family ATPase [Candidatus Adiutrix sp.]|jgi:cellulose biosynthesis protein BcsQ|nr:AAA family ATPase [Candidatus Adiutrix sp.]